MHITDDFLCELAEGFNNNCIGSLSETLEKWAELLSQRGLCFDSDAIIQLEVPIGLLEEGIEVSEITGFLRVYEDTTGDSSPGEEVDMLIDFRWDGFTSEMSWEIWKK